jgi:hypothetical protein
MLYVNSVIYFKKQKHITWFNEKIIHLIFFSLVFFKVMQYPIVNHLFHFELHERENKIEMDILILANCLSE